MTKHEYNTGLLTDGRRVVVHEQQLQNGESYIQAYIETKENYKDFELLWNKALVEQQKGFARSAGAGWPGVVRGFHVFSNWDNTYTHEFLYHNRCLFTELSQKQDNTDEDCDSCDEDSGHSTFHHSV